MGANSTLQLAINNSNAGAAAAAPGDYSKLSLGTGVSALGGSTLALNIGSVAPGDVFTIILTSGGASVSGMFGGGGTQVGATSTYSYMAGGVSYDINYAYSGAQTDFNQSETSFSAETPGNNVALLVLAVPEPNSFGMLIASLGMALGLQRFRRRRSG